MALCEENPEGQTCRIGLQITAFHTVVKDGDGLNLGEEFIKEETCESQMDMGHGVTWISVLRELDFDWLLTKGKLPIRPLDLKM